MQVSRSSPASRKPKEARACQARAWTDPAHRAQDPPRRSSLAFASSYVPTAPATAQRRMHLIRTFFFANLPGPRRGPSPGTPQAPPRHRALRPCPESAPGWGSAYGGRPRTGCAGCAGGPAGGTGSGTGSRSGSGSRCDAGPGLRGGTGVRGRARSRNRGSSSALFDAPVRPPRCAPWRRPGPPLPPPSAPRLSIPASGVRPPASGLRRPRWALQGGRRTPPVLPRPAAAGPRTPDACGDPWKRCGGGGVRQPTLTP
jgi:hypothetical protein